MKHRIDGFYLRKKYQVQLQTRSSNILCHFWKPESVCGSSFSVTCLKIDHSLSFYMLNIGGMACLGAF